MKTEPATTDIHPVAKLLRESHDLDALLRHLKMVDDLEFNDRKTVWVQALDDLPTFGGGWPVINSGIYSWDSDRILIFDPDRGFEIIARIDNSRKNSERLIAMQEKQAQQFRNEWMWALTRSGSLEELLCVLQHTERLEPEYRYRILHDAIPHLPHFGGDRPRDQSNVMSWNETTMLTYSLSEGYSIVDRSD